MAITINRTTSLDGAILPEYMPGLLYMNENQAHKFVITCTRGGSAVTLTGGITGRFMRADGQTILLSGSISSGKANLTLPQSCYITPGRFTMAIFNVTGNAVTTIYALTGNVARTQTDTLVDPGNTIPSIDNLLAEIDAMRQATAAAIAATSGALSNFAGMFDETQAYTAGKYVTYTDGKFYRLTADHAANVAWSSTSKAEVTTGGELAGLADEFTTTQRFVPSPSAATYSNLLANITDSIVTVINASDGWTDMPPNLTSGIFENIRYSNYYQLQTMRGALPSSVFYTRIVDRRDGTVFSDWARNDADLTNYQSYVPAPSAATYSNLLANITDNIITLINSYDGWTDAPIASGIFENRRYSNYYQLQTFRSTLPSGTFYTRIVDRRDGSVYSAWELNADLTNYQSYVPVRSAATYSNLLANITDNIIMVANASDGWTDMPLNAQSGVFENRRYSSYYQIQFIRGVAKESSEYTRIVDRRHGSVYRDWVQSYKTPQIRILAIGDSICRGKRNSDRGYIGNLGFPYINMGVGSATLSSVFSTYTDSIHQFSDADNIPNQLISYHGKTNAEIQTAFGVDKFTPDVIVAEGGINDYFRDAALGTMSAAPVSNDTAAAALDRNTVIGALEYMFYQMIKLYHSAQRYFVITHRTYFATASTPTYCPTTANMPGGYTQQQMHDAIVDVCNLYGVVVIDVYKNGIMDTIHPQYRATNDWSSALATDYCDKDGVHPLKYGYAQVYDPLVMSAIRTTTRK